MSIDVYSFENAEGEEEGSFSTQNLDEAKAYAERYGLRLIANVFEYTDREVVDDFTEEACP